MTIEYYLSFIFSWLRNFLDLFTQAFHLVIHIISSLTRFILKVPEALNVTMEYLSVLPSYVFAPIMLIIAVSVIYFVLGR